MSMAVTCETLITPQRQSILQNNYSVRAAQTQYELEQCQRLRYEIFFEEMGAKPEPENARARLDRDGYDPHCAHLMVIDETLGELVATTRLLSGEAAARTGGFYSQSEFALDNVLAQPGRFMEVGRTCIHPGYRSGSTIMLLWQGIARRVVTHEIDYLIGCASVTLNEGYDAAALTRYLLRQYGAAEALRATPLHPCGEEFTREGPESQHMPGLLRAYLRLGAMICGDPCLDEQFNVVDYFVLMPRARLEHRYARHFIQRN